MSTRRPLSALGVKYNPFSPDVPVEALHPSAAVDHFGWRIEQMITEGGFGLVTGHPGTGKSVALRLLEERLRTRRDIRVATLTRPRARMNDFYRELGDLFGTSIIASNRYGGFKSLRAKWLTHLDTTLFRPVLLIDEAQEMYPEILSELRMLSSAEFDSRSMVTVVLAGDERLLELLRLPELVPLGTRIRVRLTLEHMTPDDLQKLLEHRLAQCGNSALLAPVVVRSLAEHSAGNPRVLMNAGNELLDAAVSRQLATIDEKLYLEVFQPPAPVRGASPRTRR